MCQTAQLLALYNARNCQPCIACWRVVVAGIATVLNGLIPGYGINCIGADANIGALALGTANVPATRCCHQWRPVGSHTLLIPHTSTEVNLQQLAVAHWR